MIRGNSMGTQNFNHWISCNFIEMCLYYAELVYESFGELFDYELVCPIPVIPLKK